MHGTDVDVVLRIVVGFALAYAVGFERELRGSPAGDRTFSLIGTGSAAVAAVVGTTSPQALAGIVTGVGFIGGGLILRGKDDEVKGVTTAATVFSVACVGLTVGLGHLVIGAAQTGLLLITLEMRYLPLLSIFDASRYSHRFHSEPDGVAPSDPPVTSP